MFLGIPHEEVPGQDRQPYRPHLSRDGRGKGARVEKVRGCKSRSGWIGIISPDPDRDRHPGPADLDPEPDPDLYPLSQK